jgi:hypothetical protein
MFGSVKVESAQRITEVRESLAHIASNLPAPPAAPPRYLNTAKGLIFVQLYGTIEFTIVECVSKTIDVINSKAMNLDELNPVMWGMVLNPELDALMSVNRKKWDKRKQLFDKIISNSQAQISSGVMPTDGKNFDGDRFKSVWSTFCITDPVFDDPTFQLRLIDVIVQRNEIAHGAKSAADVGSSFTSNDLTVRVTEVSDFCSYVISVFEDYVTNEGYKK